MFLSIALGGAFMAWPDQFAAQWNAFKTLAERQIAIERATFDQILSGQRKIGQAPLQPGNKANSSVSVVAPVSKPPPRHVKMQGKISPVKTASPPAVEPHIISPVQQPAGPVTPAAPAASTPEAALGAILKHESRENQAKEETYWTQQRIQEALKNGAPKSNSAPCIAFCDKNNTEIEINMPKTQPDAP